MSPKKRGSDLPTPEELLDGRHPGAERFRSATSFRAKRRGCVWGLLMILIVAVALIAAALDLRF